MRCSVDCVEHEPLFDFLRGTVSKVPAPAPKRARVTGGKKAAALPVDAAATAAAETSTAPLAESDYRPLADADDDYDAD